MSFAGASFQAGAWLALRRIGRRNALGIATASVAFTAIASHAERHALAADAATRALQGPGFGLAIPFASFAVVACALDRDRLGSAMRPAAAIGANRRLAALGAITGSAFFAAALGAMIAFVTAQAAHGPPTALSIADSLTSSWIGALAACSYAFLFGAASTFGAHGGGRGVALLADLMIGPLASPIAPLFVRSHALNLLGAADAVPGWSQTSSSLGLVALSAVFALLTLRRVPP